MQSPLSSGNAGCGRITDCLSLPLKTVLENNRIIRLGMLKLNGKKGKKILIVEDSRLTSKIVEELLSENGYETEIVITGEEAIEKSLDNYPPNLILMDIELAGEMNGIDAARRIIGDKDIPIVFLTANTSEEIILKIKEVRAYGFVLKGMDKAALLSTVEMAMQLHEANTYAKMFEQLFENSLSGLYIFHPKSLKFVVVNKSARENLGYAREELMQMSPLDINPDLDKDNLQKLIEQLVSGEREQILLNKVYRRKDGSLYPGEVNLQLLNYRGEKFCIESVLDLTEHKAMAEGLQEKETTLNAVMDAARDAIIMLDGQGKVSFWNPAAEQLFGYSQEEAVGNLLHQLVIQDNRVYEVYHQAFEYYQLTEIDDAAGKTLELEAKHKNGHELEIELSLSALRIRGALYVLVIVRDVSERKRAQQEIENSQKRYLELAEDAPIGVLICTVDGKISYINQKALEIFGSPSAEETMKVNLFSFPPLVKYGFSSQLEKCLRNNESGIYEMNYESKWGKKVWLRLHGKPLTNGDKVIGAQIIIDDITVKKQQEEELRYLTVTDYLTNTYNRRFFIQKLKEEMERARRSGTSFSLIMMDIDHFKRINDCFGHNAGDLVLKLIAETINNRIRKIDTLARWGGEEFVILLLDTTVQNAVHFAGELREKISQLDIPDVGRVTASFGVAAYRPGDTIDTLIQRADDLMYEAKASGRNCVR